MWSLYKREEEETWHTTGWACVRACARPGYAKCTCASPASCWRVHPLWDRLHDQWSVSSECWQSSRAARAAADSLWNIHHQLCFIFLRIHLKSAVRVFQFPPVMRTDTQTSRYQTAWEVNVTSSLRAHTHTHTHTHARTPQDGGWRRALTAGWCRVMVFVLLRVMKLQSVICPSALSLSHASCLRSDPGIFLLHLLLLSAKYIYPSLHVGLVCGGCCHLLAAVSHWLLRLCNRSELVIWCWGVLSWWTVHRITRERVRINTVCALLLLVLHKCYRREKALEWSDPCEAPQAVLTAELDAPQDPLSAPPSLKQASSS